MMLTLNFSTVSGKTTAGKGCKDHCLLASGGRDRLIHVYDVDRGFDVIATLDDHSSSITTVKFACNSSKLLSCSADKSVVFRNIATAGSGCKSIRYHRELHLVALYMTWNKGLQIRIKKLKKENGLRSIRWLTLSK